MRKVKVNANMLFERNEKKYLLTQKQYEQISTILMSHMHVDEYGLHTIGTIYYDTDDYAIIRKSLDKPKFKEKLRLRSYGAVSKKDIVYIELKKKFSGVTYKRRMGLPLEKAMDYLEKGIIPEASKDNLQTFGEIDWFVKKYKPSAKAIISYNRIALVGDEDPDFRITFDASISWRDYNLDPSRGYNGSLLRRAGTKLMEIKTIGSLPLWICKILSHLKIYPISFSKMGKVYTEHLMEPIKEVVRIAG